ncbi:hypothetical protein [Leptospira ilyithenensis]|uniref:Lipoprotein n=1 Tax=Leptospira ilyithenensis TaxID=2484901 RepID=A0A4R9LNE2_9LEPT|nr:hypothetical protein [Leptospira ilyithenensis]TGN10285.1 hypothetical protein EHS11_09995 [Leptospira ilyithenensis]
MHKIKNHCYSLIICFILFSCNSGKAPNKFKHCNSQGIIYEDFLHLHLEGLFDEICEQINIRKNTCDQEVSEMKIIKKIKHKCFGVQDGSLIPMSGSRLLLDPKEKISQSFENNLQGMCILQGYIDINLQEEVFPFVTAYCVQI